MSNLRPATLHLNFCNDFSAPVSETHQTEWNFTCNAFAKGRKIENHIHHSSTTHQAILEHLALLCLEVGKQQQQGNPQNEFPNVELYEKLTREEQENSGL